MIKYFIAVNCREQKYHFILKTITDIFLLPIFAADFNCEVVGPVAQLDRASRF